MIINEMTYNNAGGGVDMNGRKFLILDQQW